MFLGLHLPFIYTFLLDLLFFKTDMTPILSCYIKVNLKFRSLIKISYHLRLLSTSNVEHVNLII